MDTEQTAAIAMDARDALVLLAQNPTTLSPLAKEVILDAESAWMRLIDAAKPKSAPAPAPDASIEAKQPAPPHKAHVSPIPPTLRPAWDTRSLCQPRQKMAGQ